MQTCKLSLYRLFLETLKYRNKIEKYPFQKRSSQVSSECMVGGGDQLSAWEITYRVLAPRPTLRLFFFFIFFLRKKNIKWKRKSLINYSRPRHFSHSRLMSAGFLAPNWAGNGLSLPLFFFLGIFLDGILTT